MNYFGLENLLSLDEVICYGHCMLSFGSTIFVIATLHKGLKVVCAPFLLHQVVNLSALSILFGGPNLLSAHQLSAELLFSFSKTFKLAIGLLCIFARVQWTYSNCRSRIHQACKTPTAFSETFETSMQQLNSLHLQLCFFRYTMVAAFCTFHFTNVQTKFHDTNYLNN